MVSTRCLSMHVSSFSAACVITFVLAISTFALRTTSFTTYN